MNPRFRLATVSDAELLLDFMREYYAFDGHPYDRARARPALVGLLHNSSLGRVWLVLDEGAPVGYVVLCFGYSLEYLGRDAFLDEFYLRPEYRGRGWGRMTMDFVEEQARLEEVRSIHLEVVRPNLHAVEVYRRLGFRDHDHHLMSKWMEQKFAQPRREER